MGQWIPGVRLAFFVSKLFHLLFLVLIGFAEYLFTNYLFAIMHILVGVSHDESKPLHSRHSMIIVPLNSPGLSIKRYLSVFGYDDAPHGHAEVIKSNQIKSNHTIHNNKKKNKKS